MQYQETYIVTIYFLWGAVYNQVKSTAVLDAITYF